MPAASHSPPDAPPTVAVCADPADDRTLLAAAARLSVDLNLPFHSTAPSAGVEMLLVVTPRRIELRVLEGDPQLRGGRAVYVDLGRVDATSGPGRSLRQPIMRAVGRLRMNDPAPTVIDATAGWGEDAWLMASLGCNVLAIERSPIVATLLRDGLLRAGADHPDVLSRLSLVTTDARAALRRIARLQASGAPLPGDLPAPMGQFLHPDVVYLDPMYPSARKGAQRKPLRLLRRLVGADADAGELLAAARRVARRRVVVKRPVHADPLGDVNPTTKHTGKSARYDVYATADQ